MARPTLFRHRKFSRLARILGSEALAVGHLELMWSAAYESGEELVGDSADVEYAAKWAGEAGKLTAALTQCGFLDSTKDGLVIHDLWDHAPEYVRKRRSREMERRTTGAKLRRTADTVQSPTSQRPVRRQPRKVLDLPVNHADIVTATAPVLSEMMPSARNYTVEDFEALGLSPPDEPT